MTAEEGFYSIQAQAVAGLTVKGSKFIAHAAPAATKELAENYFATIAKKYTDATHNCYAYKIGVGDQSLVRSYDAREPSGTAGRPILQAIEAKKMTNVVVVVTRYFGGTKLGTGGLMRAYYSVALAALEKAVMVKEYLQITVHLNLSYQLSKIVQQALEKYDAQIVGSEFQERIDYFVKIKALDATAFVKELKDLTGGKIAIEVIDDSEV